MRDINYSDPAEKKFLLSGDKARYPNYTDANMRLAGTFVNFQKEPILVREFTGDGCNMIVTIYNRRNGRCETSNYVMSANDERLNIASPRIGFVNHKGKAFYITRRPIRSQKQGLSVANCDVYDISSGSFTGLGVSVPLYSDISDTLRNEFPSIEEVLERSSGGISRTWGLSKTKDSKVFLANHKMYPVALFFPDEKRFAFGKYQLNALRHKSLTNILSKQPSGGEYHVGHK